MWQNGISTVALIVVNYEVVNTGGFGFIFEWTKRRALFSIEVLCGKIPKI